MRCNIPSGNGLVSGQLRSTALMSNHAVQYVWHAIIWSILLIHVRMSSEAPLAQGHHWPDSLLEEFDH